MAFNKRPKAINCYICGQQYGTTSIDIHIPQCVKKWEKVEEQKPKKERRPVPPKPQSFDAAITGVKSGDYSGIDAMNVDTFDSYNTNALVPCVCGRTFLPDSLKRHQKGCKGAQQAAKNGGPPVGSTPGQKAASNSLGIDKYGNPVEKVKTLVRPKALMCYICGREFGTASLGIHIPQCIKKWDKVEAQKPKEERRKCPQAPQEFDEAIKGIGTKEFDTDAFNAAQYENYNDKALVKCEGCSRTFLPDSLKRHQVMCLKGKTLQPKDLAKMGGGLPKGVGSSTMQPEKPQGREKGQRPKALMCYICGREFGTQSLQIHIPQCIKKWDKVEALKDPKDRRKCPDPPQEFDEAIKGIGNKEFDTDAFNAKQYENYNDKALVPCDGCGRTFLPDSLLRHKKGCKGKGVSKSKASGGVGASTTSLPSLKQPPQTEKKPMTKDPAMKPRAMMCHICGREFGTASLEIHLKSCTVKFEREQLLKPVKERKPVPEKPSTPVEFNQAIGGSGSGGYGGIDAYNAQAFDQYNTKALEPCKNCGRTFLPESLVKHAKTCKGVGSQSISGLRKSQAGGMSDQSTQGESNGYQPSPNRNHRRIIDKKKLSYTPSNNKLSPLQNSNALSPTPGGQDPYGVQTHQKVMDGRKSLQNSESPYANKMMQKLGQGLIRRPSIRDLRGSNTGSIGALAGLSALGGNSNTLGPRGQGMDQLRSGAQSTLHNSSESNQTNNGMGNGLKIPTLPSRDKGNACTSCGRTFSQNIMAMHVKSCQKRFGVNNQGAKQAQSTSTLPML